MSIDAPLPEEDGEKDAIGLSFFLRSYSSFQPPM